MRSIPVSLLDLATVRAGEGIPEAIDGTVAVARHVEKLGYHRIWLAEHHNMEHIASSATAVLIGHVAGKTERIRVGSGGIMLPNHAPLVIAEQFGTLETIYPGRIDLGLGRAPGTDQLTAMALRRNRMDAHYDFAGEIQQLQTYFSAENNQAKVRAFPGEGLDIPIWILGSSTDSAHLAAAMGLPYAFAAHFAPAQFERAVQIYKSTFKPSRYLGRPRMMACVNVIGADTKDQAQWLSSSLYRLFSGIITQERAPLQPPGPLPDIFQHPELRRAIESMTAGTFIGAPASLKQELRAFIQQYGLDELMVVSYIYDREAKFRSLEMVKEALS